MKKTITKIFWIAAFSISPALSMENDKGSEEQKAFSKTQHWENGQMVWEKIEYAPTLEASKPIRPSGMGAWESMAMSLIAQDSPTIVYGQNDGW